MHVHAAPRALPQQSLLLLINALGAVCLLVAFADPSLDGGNNVCLMHNRQAGVPLTQPDGLKLVTGTDCLMDICNESWIERGS